MSGTAKRDCAATRNSSFENFIDRKGAPSPNEFANRSLDENTKAMRRWSAEGSSPARNWRPLARKPLISSKALFWTLPIRQSKPSSGRSETALWGGFAGSPLDQVANTPANRNPYRHPPRSGQGGQGRVGLGQVGGCGSRGHLGFFKFAPLVPAIAKSNRGYFDVGASSQGRSTPISPGFFHRGFHQAQTYKRS